MKLENKKVSHGANEWAMPLFVGIIALAVVILAVSRAKIPAAHQTASVIDIGLTDPVPADSVLTTDTVVGEPALTESAPADSTSAIPAESASISGESASTTAAGVTNFTELLQTVTDSVKNFVEPVPVGIVPVSFETISLMEQVVPKGASRVKIFVLAQDALESALNNWLAAQQSIVVDQLTVQDYGGGGYLVVISYHTGGTGNSSARLKIIAGENSEADAQTFLSSLGASQTVRSVAAVAGSYSMPEKTITVPIIFIVYE